MTTETEPGTEPTRVTMNAALYTALSQAQAKARGVEKDSNNSFHHYKYASAESLIAEAKECLSAAGLAVMPSDSRIKQLEAAFGSIEGRGGAVAMLHATWLIVHSGGGSMELHTEWPVVPEKGRPIDKAIAAARTASLGYLLRDLLQLPRVEEGTGLDDDARDRNDDEPAQRPQPQRREQPAKPAVTAPTPLEIVKRAVMAELAKAGVKKDGMSAAVREMCGGNAPASLDDWNNALDQCRAEAAKKEQAAA